MLIPANADQWAATMLLPDWLVNQGICLDRPRADQIELQRYREGRQIAGCTAACTHVFSSCSAASGPMSVLCCFWRFLELSCETFHS